MCFEITTSYYTRSHHIYSSIHKMFTCIEKPLSFKMARQFYIACIKSRLLKSEGYSNSEVKEIFTRAGFNLDKEIIETVLEQTVSYIKTKSGIFFMREIYFKEGKLNYSYSQDINKSHFQNRCSKYNKQEKKEKSIKRIEKEKDGKKRYKRHYWKSAFIKSFYKEREVTKHFKRIIQENYET